MEQLADTKAEFLDELDDFYDEVEAWVKDQGLETARGEKQIREEEFGIYNAPTLQIRQGERIIARLDPVGASIIGADGRVDLKGRVTSEIISLFEKPRPSIAIPQTFEEVASSQRAHPFYPDITESGWYWIEFRVRGRARRMSKELFIELLRRVSNNGTY
jgi:hypothetical protein